MTHPIIKTDNYLLITSDEEIKVGDYWHYLGEKDDPVKNVLVRSWFEKLHDAKMYKKVIAHLPLNNEPVLEGVPLLPPLPNEDDEIIENLENYLLKVNQLYKDWLGIGFKGGYHKAKEKYKFTDEDVRFIILKSFLLGVDRGEYSKELEDRLVSSLSQPKLPIGFKCEIEVDCTGNDNNGCFMDAPGHNCGCVKTKIINGVMQGEWIFE